MTLNGTYKALSFDAQGVAVHLSIRKADITFHNVSTLEWNKSMSDGIYTIIRSNYHKDGAKIPQDKIIGVSIDAEESLHAESRKISKHLPVNATKNSILLIEFRQPHAELISELSTAIPEASVAQTDEYTGRPAVVIVESDEGIRKANERSPHSEIIVYRSWIGKDPVVAMHYGLMLASKWGITGFASTRGDLIAAARKAFLRKTG